MMAEARVRSTDTESSNSDSKRLNKYGLAFNEFREEEIEEGQDRKRQRKENTSAICGVCVNQNVIAFSKNVAFNLCSTCEQYLCDQCFKGHESHTFVKLVSDKGERDGQINSFLDEMKNESQIEETLEREEVSVVDRVNVKHKLDENDCEITGLCGLTTSNWAVSDYLNSCIKLFSVGSNILQRYIRFGSPPWGVSEVYVERKPAGQEGMCTIETDNCDTNQSQSDKQFLLAVTIPWLLKIWLIDLTQNPAEITLSIKTETPCHSIEFSESKIFTLCGDRGVSGPCIIYVLSTEGKTEKTIKTGLQSCLPFFTVSQRRVFITDWNRHKVLCLNDEGTLVSYKTIDRLGPVGISVDPDTKKVYVCDQLQNKIYRFDCNLERSESLLDLKSVNLDKPRALHFYKDRLYVGHGRWSTQNYVTVIRVV